MAYFYLIYHVFFGRGNNKVGDNFGIRGSAERIARIRELFIQVFCINDITIVGDSYSIRAFTYQDRLDITHLTGTTGGVAIMSNGYIPSQVAQGVFIKYLGYQAHIGKILDSLTVCGSDTATLLTTVLEGK